MALACYRILIWPRPILTNCPSTATTLNEFAGRNNLRSAPCSFSPWWLCPAFLSLDVGCWMLDVRCWMLDVGCWMLDVGCWMLDVVDRPSASASLSAVLVGNGLVLFASARFWHPRMQSSPARGSGGRFPFGPKVTTGYPLPTLPAGLAARTGFRTLLPAQCIADLAGSSASRNRMRGQRRK